MRPFARERWGYKRESMTLKIRRATNEKFVVFTLSCRIEVEHVAELLRLFELEAEDNSIVLVYVK